MVGTSDYLRWTGAEPVAEPPAVTPSCDRLRDPIAAPSMDQVLARLEGTWLRCGESSAFGAVAAGEVGFEVIGDRWYRVYEQADGRLVRCDGADQEGWVEVVDTSAMNGPGAYQVDVTVLDVGIVLVQPTFFASPDAVRMSNWPAADYLRWTGAQPVVASSPPSPPAAPAGPGTGATGALPSTGSGTSLLGPAAAGVALGALLLVAARRRRAGAVVARTG
jgi:LPXTG-motif cell wall-anchored protein